MTPDELATAAGEFEAAKARGEHFPKSWHDRLSLDDAYRLQLELIRRHCRASGQRRVGWKVGLTARAIQQQFGFHEPVFACLLDGGRQPSGHRFRHADLIRPGFENELCVTLGRDIAPGATMADVEAAVESVRPAFEIIETRGDFAGQVALALADNGQQHSFVVGEPTPPAAAMLKDCEAVVVVNGKEVGRGRGEAVLGHPYLSLVWLASKLADYGEALKAGEVVMTGSFTRQFPIAPGDRIETSFAGVGTVTAEFV